MISAFHASTNPALPAIVDIANRINRVDHPTLADCILAMIDSAFELDSEEAALLLLAVNEAAVGGYNFTALELALVDVIRRQLAAGSDDSEPEITEDVDDDALSAELTDGDGLYWPQPSEAAAMARANNRTRRVGANLRRAI